MTNVSSQTKLFRAEGDRESVTRPYVPILLIKQGERQALEKVDQSTRALFTPWIRVLPPEAAGENAERTRSRELGRLAKVSGSDAVYLDVAGTPRRGRARARLGMPFVRQVYIEALSVDLPFVPVVPFDRPDLSETTAEFQSAALGASVLIRSDTVVMTGNRKFEDLLRDQVRQLAIEPARLDVMIDLGYIPSGLAGWESAVWLVRKVVGAVPWRSVILAGTSVPESFAAEVPDDSVGAVERREREVFQAVQRAVGVALRYGDYAVQNPYPPKSGFAKKARANIRYTSGSYLHVSRGGRALGEISRNDWPTEFHRAAARLIREAPFAGSDCCWGDQVVQDLATGARQARSHSGMRAAATCHHLSVVARELTPSKPQVARPTYARRVHATVTESL